jgi:hypothetical protein
MFVAVEDVVDEAVDDRRLPHCLISQEDDLVLQKRRNRSFGEVQVAYVRH